ncbi:MAG TPA: hypothetical protein VLG11_06240 [Candidatus Saccharimonadales bacterium]|nr:hypothetical protein [Candidatus Saccharimonadales bacterium]
MKTAYFKRTVLGLGAILSVAGMALSGGSAYAAAAQTPTDAQRVQTIIAKGNQEITRRLTVLGTLSSKVAGAAKLTASDKAALTTEVANATAGLTQLKTKLDADTTIAAARADAQSIFDEYRVYALVAPKIALIRTADDQQSVDAKLTTLAGKLQTRLDSAKSAGKDVAALQAKLDDMKAKTTAAAGIASSVEQAVIGLQPSDYNSNHSVLSGYRAQLQTAHSDNQAAVADAKAIVAGLENL